MKRLTQFILDVLRRRSASRRRSSSPPARSSGSATTRCGTAPRARCRRRSRRRGCRTSSSRATARSTARRSTSTSPTRIGRKWQLGTIQLDYNAPERFDLDVRRRGQRRASPGGHPPRGYGSFERFIAILIEHFAGAFPVWLAPEQVRVLPISDAQAAAASRLTERLAAAGFRATWTTARDAQLPHPRGRGGEDPVHGGGRAARGRQRQPGAPGARGGKKQEVMPVEAFLERVTEEVRTRALAP